MDSALRPGRQGRHRHGVVAGNRTRDRGRRSRSTGRGWSCRAARRTPARRWRPGFATPVGEAVDLPCNVSHEDQMRDLVEGTLATWGRIDVLVANAAANPLLRPLPRHPRRCVRQDHAREPARRHEARPHGHSGHAESPGRGHHRGLEHRSAQGLRLSRDLQPEQDRAA